MIYFYQGSEIFMELEYIEVQRNISNDELISDMIRVSQLLNQSTLTAAEYDRYGNFHSRTISKRFNTWNNALIIANLQISNRFYTDEELFDNLAKIWVRLGKQPSKRDLALVGSDISYKAYERRFGRWSTALKSFVEYFNAKQGDLSNTMVDIDQYIYNRRISSRDINLRLRFLVMSRDNFKCCLCGASPAKDPSVVLHVDHIKPWSKGGVTEINNLQTLCSRCNQGKSDLEPI